MAKGEIIAGIDLGPGRVLYDDLLVDSTRPLMEQVDLLKEDLMQIEFPAEVLIDVGWYPSFKPTGQFQVRVVKNRSWDPPFSLLAAPDLDKLRQCIRAAVGTALRLSLAR